MPDIFYLFSKWWKQILLVVVLSLAIVGTIIYLKPNLYLSTSTAVPGNVVSADKSRVFSENIQSLYSDLGLPEDIDVIIGTGQLDTIYLSVTDQYNLFDHYKVPEQGNEARIKAAYLLKKYSKVMKSEYGELKVKVWDTDKMLAPQLVNALMETLKTIHQDLQNENNRSILKTLQSTQRQMQLLLDSMEKRTGLDKNEIEKNNALKRILSDRIVQYEKLINEYQLMVDSKPPALVVVEKARYSPWPDKPKRTQIMIIVAFLSILFAFFLALLLEKRKSNKP